MNLSQFKVIPQSNVRKGEASLEELKPLFVPEVVKPDLVFNTETERFFITLKFIKEQEENQGFTAITDGESTYLIRTSETDANKDLHPKFFRGNKTQYATSDYLRLLTKDLGDNLFLHETKIEDYQAYLVSKDSVSPFKSEINVEIPVYQTQIETYSDLTQHTTVQEESILPSDNDFTYASDLLDQPVQENTEEPSLF